MSLIKREKSGSNDKISRLLTNEYFVLALILGIAAFLRFYGLNAKSIWYDEACSLNLAAYNWYDTFFSSKVITNIPRPGYFVFLKLWTGLFGWTEVAARSLSVILGILSVLLVYKLARKLFSTPVGLISAFLLAISPYNIYYSQQIRYYALFLCLSLLSLIFFLKILKDNKLKYRVLYILSNILILVTFPLGIYIIILENIFLFILRDRVKVKLPWLKIQAVILAGLLSMVLIHVVYLILHKGQDAIDFFAGPRPKPSFLAEALEVFSYGGYAQGHAGLGFPSDPSRLFFPRVLTVLFCSLFALSLFFRRRDGAVNKGFLREDRTVLMLWLWLFLPLLGFYLFSIWFAPVYVTRYFLGIAPAFYIGIAYSISRIRIVKPTAILVISLLTVFSLDILYNPGSRNDWRALAKEIKPQVRSNDVIVFAPIMQIIPFWYYYKYDRVKGFNNNIDNYGDKFYHMNNCVIDYGGNGIVGLGLKDDNNYILAALASALKGKNNIWLINSPHWAGRERSEFIRGILNDNRVVTYQKYFEYEGVEAICYSLP